MRILTHPRASLLVLLLTVACEHATTMPPTERSAVSALEPTADDDGHVTVMTRNMYVGVDVNVVIAAIRTPDPADDLPALLTSVDVISRTDFPARVSALADEIARARPHVVGLQEVDDVEIDIRPLRPRVSLHFLPMLQAALSSRGLNYVVAGDVANFAVAPVPGVSLTDHDVILVDAARVSVGPSVIERHYALNIGTLAPGVEVRRGWVQIVATISGVDMTIASTHLEAIGPPALRTGQARELVQSVGTTLPAVLLGDFNDVPDSATHLVITNAGFIDAWSALRPTESGSTCCQLADLSNAQSLLARRIDYLFTRGFDDAQKGLKGKVTLVGDQPDDRIPAAFYALWPSDHAGVVGRFGVGSAPDTPMEGRAP